MKLSIPEQLETERLLLQRLKYEDAEEIFYTYASKPESTRFMLWPTHKTIEDSRLFLRYAVKGWNAGTDYSFSIRLKKLNRFIGSCGMIHDVGKIQFGYVLSPSHWGNGFATEVCQKLMATVRAIPEIYRVNTFVDAENIASANVLRKAGLIEEARLEKWFRFVNQDNQPKDCLLFRLPL
ncbi:MAG TPA: GNAT family N-acetyltransferase [Cyclobacteriaceae bacterium]|nr:GNAT family N-acetyltransferase [Cyclobacteriaceae bacterium]